MLYRKKNQDSSLLDFIQFVFFMLSRQPIYTNPVIIIYKTKSVFCILPDIKENVQINQLICQANIVINTYVKLVIFEYVRNISTAIT